MYCVGRVWILITFDWLQNEIGSRFISLLPSSFVQIKLLSAGFSHCCQILPQIPFKLATIQIIKIYITIPTFTSVCLFSCAAFVTLQYYIALLAPEVQISLLRFVTYALLITKIHPGSPSDPWAQISIEKISL